MPIAKDRDYKGTLIRECERPRGMHSGRWLIQTYHEATGLPWSDELCPHYPTLAAAKAAVEAGEEEDAKSHQ